MAYTEPDDEDLITILRRNAHEELRVTVATFKGHQYIGLRVWAECKDGIQRPVKGKGCTIRMAELGQMIQALEYIKSNTIPIDYSEYF